MNNLFLAIEFSDWLDHGLAVMVGVSLLAVGFPRVLKYQDRKTKEFVLMITSLNEKNIETIEKLTNDHEIKMAERAGQYEIRLDAKDKRINQVVDETYKTIHDFRAILDRQNELIVSVREDVRPIKAMAPMIQDVTNNINRLVKIIEQ
jgi:hypothetical protein